MVAPNQAFWFLPTPVTVGVSIVGLLLLIAVLWLQFRGR